MPILYDSFTDADGTQLSAHTSDSGHSWVFLAGSQTASRIYNNRVESRSYTVSWWYANASYVSSPQYIEATLSAQGYHSSYRPQWWLGLISSVSGTDFTGYTLYIEQNGSTTKAIYFRRHATRNSYTDLASQTNYSSSPTSTLSVRIEWRDNTFKIYLNSTLWNTVTDSTYSGFIPLFNIVGNSSASSSAYLDDLTWGLLDPCADIVPSSSPSYDEFNGSGSLDSHLSDSSHTWHPQTIVESEIIELANGAATNSTNKINAVSRMRNSYVPRNADYDVAICFVPNQLVSGMRIGVGGRWDASFSQLHGYFAYATDSGTVELRKFISGVSTLLGSGGTVVAGDPHLLVLRLRGTNITVQLNGATIISATDGSITSKGYGGLWLGWSPDIAVGTLNINFYFLDDRYSTTQSADRNVVLADTSTAYDSLIRNITSKRIGISDSARGIDGPNVNKTNIGTGISDITFGGDTVYVDKSGDMSITLIEAGAVTDDVGLMDKLVALTDISMSQELLYNSGTERYLEVGDLAPTTDAPSLVGKELWLAELLSALDDSALVTPIEDLLEYSESIGVMPFASITDSLNANDRLAMFIQCLINDGTSASDIVSAIQGLIEACLLQEAIVMGKESPSMDNVQANDSVSVWRDLFEPFVPPDIVFVITDKPTRFLAVAKEGGQ